MKNQILDAPFRDSFEDFLGKRETIIWQGQPAKNPPFTNKIGVIFIALSVTFLYKWDTFSYWAILFIVLLLGSHIIATKLKNRKKEKVHYAITQKQVLFQFKNITDSKIYSLPFNELSEVTSARSENEYHRIFRNEIGIIFLTPKNLTPIPFTTYRFDFKRKRPQPTLELIEDTEMVTELIQEGIQNANTLL